MRVLDGSLTSLAPGGYVRAYFDGNDPPLLHEVVEVADELDEERAVGEVVQFSGPFVYVRLVWP